MFKTRVLVIFIIMAFPMHIFSQEGLAKFFENFALGTAERWEPHDKESWEVVKEKGNNYYLLKRTGAQTGTIRKPAAFSLIRDLSFSDFTLTLKAKCLRSIDTKGRDIIIVFAYQDETHFYYAHLSNYHDDVHNSILIVNGKDREPILSGESIPRLKDKEFHDIRLRRHIESGLIEVYVDDFDFPIMTAVDKTLLWGRIGVGSFDDTGGFDDVRVIGKVRR